MYISDDLCNPKCVIDWTLSACVFCSSSPAILFSEWVCDYRFRLCSLHFRTIHVSVIAFLFSNFFFSRKKKRSESCFANSSFIYSNKYFLFYIFCCLWQWLVRKFFHTFNFQLITLNKHLRKRREIFTTETQSCSHIIQWDILILNMPTFFFGYQTMYRNYFDRNRQNCNPYWTRFRLPTQVIPHL